MAGQELRDLWVGGRGAGARFAFSILVSAITYVGATNRALNFLEQRETVNLTLQVAVAVGALLALLAAADAISGERERGTLESLLLTPVSRRRDRRRQAARGAVAVGRGLVVAVPYVWFLGRDVGAVDDAVAAGLVVGTLVAVSLTAFGIIVSSLRELQPREPLGEPVRAAGAVRADAAAGRRQAGVGRRAAAARQPDDRRRALHRATSSINQYDWTRELSWLMRPARRSGRADGRGGARSAALPVAARRRGRVRAVRACSSPPR